MSYLSLGVFTCILHERTVQVSRSGSHSRAHHHEDNIRLSRPLRVYSLSLCHRHTVSPSQSGLPAKISVFWWYLRYNPGAWSDWWYPVLHAYSLWENVHFPQHNRWYTEEDCFSLIFLSSHGWSDRWEDSWSRTERAVRVWKIDRSLAWVMSSGEVRKNQKDTADVYCIWYGISGEARPLLWRLWHSLRKIDDQRHLL